MQKEPNERSRKRPFGMPTRPERCSAARRQCLLHENTPFYPLINGKNRGGPGSLPGNIRAAAPCRIPIRRLHLVKAHDLAAQNSAAQGLLCGRNDRFGCGAMRGVHGDADAGLHRCSITGVDKAQAFQ